MIVCTSRACDIAILLSFFVLSVVGAERPLFDYKEFYHRSIKPYIIAEQTDIAVIQHRAALLDSIEKLDVPDQKKIVSFLVCHPLLTTTDKKDLLHIKKRDMLFFLAGKQIISSQEYLDHIAMLCYFPTLIHAPAMGYGIRKLLADWGVNPLWNKKKNWQEALQLYSPAVRNQLIKSASCVKNQTYCNHLIDDLSNASIEHYINHTHECALQRLSFYKRQITDNAAFNKKSVPTLAAMIGIKLINNAISWDEHEKKIIIPKTLVGFFKQLNISQQNLFLSLLMFHPNSPINSVFSLARKLSTLNAIYPVMSVQQYVYYRTIIEYFSSILTVNNLSLSVVHKILDMGGDPRAVLNNCSAIKKTALKALEGCDYRWANLAILNIISFEKKCFKACEEKLSYYLMHLQNETFVDFTPYFLQAIKEKNYYALKFLLRVVRPGKNDLQKFKNNHIEDKKIKKILENYFTD
ncbi:MAG: hypothetical protein ACOYT8_01880 [Candidatus Dependentiae bacterium]